MTNDELTEEVERLKNQVLALEKEHALLSRYTDSVEKRCQETESDLTKLKNGLGEAIHGAIKENGNALGAVLTRRFQTLEAIVDILIRESAPEVRRRVE